MNQSINEKVKDDLEEELYLFNTGEHFDSYLIMGCKQENYEGKVGFRFTVWAPNAKDVGLVGDFSDWHIGIEMERIGKTGCWTVFSEQAVE
ncbi:MAG: 1,4-alpha-glucan branching enzyme, partial [Carnobacterium alterfunditum]